MSSKRILQRKAIVGLVALWGCAPSDRDDVGPKLDATGLGDAASESDAGTAVTGDADASSDDASSDAGDGSTRSQTCVTCADAICACGKQVGAGGTWGSCTVDATFAIGDLDWPMPNAPTANLPNAARYDASVAGVVVDQVTGLAWQRTVDGRRAWADARAYCSALDLGGSQWRLPTVIELMSLVDDTKSSPSIDSVAFPDTPSAYFWTASPLAGSSSMGWNVYFGLGDAYYYDAAETNAVRCVRVDAPQQRGAVPARCFVVGAGTIYDERTKLTWQRSVDAGSSTWADAMAYCQNLGLDGGGWRLPRLNELRTIVDYTRSGPAVDPVAFPDTPSVNFWTSSSFVRTPGNAWYVYFDDGFAGYNAETSAYGVRCVR